MIPTKGYFGNLQQNIMIDDKTKQRIKSMNIFSVFFRTCVDSANSLSSQENPLEWDEKIK